MKTISPAYGTKASGDQNQPLELYDIFLDSETLRFVNYNKNITFFDLQGNSATYTGLPIHREVLERSVENPINTVVIGIANVDRSLSSYLASNEFRGRNIVIRKVFADQLTLSGDAIYIFDGVMDSPSADENFCQVQATDRIGTLRREAPRLWYQLLCNHKFGNDECFFGRTSGDMYANVNGTCFSGNTKSIVKSLNITQAADYWIDGEVRFTSGQNALKKRKVTTSSGDSLNLFKLDVALSNIPVSGDTFTIRRGCDKTLFRCSGDFQNQANFLGFPTLPQNMIIR